MDEKKRVIMDSAIAISNTEIVMVGKKAEIKQKFGTDTKIDVKMCSEKIC
ncbi:MAG: hypothetical protein ACP6IP_04325 [Candidatus Njordarchaeia archaeon]